MSLVVSALLITITLLLSVPVLILLLQAVVAMGRSGRKRPVLVGARPKSAVLVPAHNEAEVIARTVANVREQMDEGDRVIVVADNCLDDTAARAAAVGAEVVIRNEPTRMGKGYALDAGIRYLAQTEQVDVVVVLDADCMFQGNSLDDLARTCTQSDRPTQAAYEVIEGEGCGGVSGIARFAWLIKGRLRPAGYLWLGLPCQLMGTGMALPWCQIEQCRLATGCVAEDVALGLELTLHGHPPQFYPEATVVSESPPTAEGRNAQRTRWVHGYLSVLSAYLFRLIAVSIRKRDMAALALALDLSVPPLSVLVLAVGGVFMGSLAWLMISGEATPFLASLFPNLGLAVFLIIAWNYCGRGLIGWRELASLPHYVASVARMVWMYAIGRRSGWLRAERAK